MQRIPIQPERRLTPETQSLDDLAHSALPVLSPVLTVPEVARELRCSKAHAHNLINGKVRGAKPLPSVKIGRRCLVRRSTLLEWIKANERCYDPIIASY
jgi:excisionase family DNA binding protein